MFGNNNKDIIKRVTKRSIYTNRARNIFATLAIMLTTIMIFSVFSIGISFMNNYQTMVVRMNGTGADASLNQANEKQYKQIKAMDGVEEVGQQIYIGTEVRESAVTGEEFTLLHWFYDQTEWESHYKGAISDIEGSYPEETNEIMLSEGALRQLGINKPEVGMEIPLDQTYVLSGWFTQYTQSELVFHSEEFCRENGYTPEKSGVVSVSLADGSKDAVTEMLELMDLKEGQEWSYGFAMEGSSSTNLNVTILVVMISLFIVLSGYLFIYNVMYISVTKDIQFYGMLKTIGTSPKQIRKIVRGQAYLFALIGIPAGMLIGTLISFGMVPAALSVMDGLSAMPGDVSFHPAVFVGTIAFSLLSIVISCRKPARIAAKVSPIEAAKFTGTDGEQKRRERNSVKGGRLGQMALYNVFRYKKRAVLVFVSLFLGTITILCVNGFLGSLSIENFIDRYMPYDITVTNSDSQDENGVSPQMFEQIAAQDGVEEVVYTRTADISLRFDKDVYAPFLEAEVGKEENPEEILAELATPGNEFKTKLVDVNPEVLKAYNESADQLVDLKAFEAGQTAMVGLGDALENPAAMIGKTITVINEQQEETELVIAGVFGHEDVDFYGEFKTIGAPDAVYVSEAALQQITDEAPIYQLKMNVQPDKLEQVSAVTGEILEYTSEWVLFSSRLDLAESFESAMQTMSVLGNGVSFILILVGMLNFVNVMLTGVYTRRRELAVMESVGMTKKQIFKMLTFEGGYYAVISSLLILTVGSGVLALVAKLAPSVADYAKFQYPTMLVITLIIAIFAICLLVPGVVYRTAVKESVTERLRATEA